jgi:hypothetical protein
VTHSAVANAIVRDLENDHALPGPRDGEIHSLNPTWGRVWFTLPARTPDELANALLSKFDASRARALEDAQTLIAVLQGAGLVSSDDDLTD